MAFCNSCGTNITAGTRFCNKCGAPILTSTLPPTTAATAPPAGTPSASSGAPAASTTAPSSGGGALKVILIVVGVIVVVGILGLAALGIFVHQIARHARVHHNGDNVKVETPFGSVESTKDPQEAARNLGVDLYPGAQVKKEGASSVTFGAVHTVTLIFEAPDSLDKVCSFYKSRFSKAMVVSSDANQCTIVSDDHKNVITINMNAAGDKTKVVISNVSRKGDAAN